MRATTTRGLALPSDLAVLRLTLSRILIGGRRLSPLLGSLTLCNVSNFAQTPRAVGPMLTDGEGNFLADAEFAVLLVFAEDKRLFQRHADDLEREAVRLERADDS